MKLKLSFVHRGLRWLARTPDAAQTSVMAAPADRLLLTSIHDVSPRFESEVDRLLEVVRPLVGEQLAMLVVPNHWGDAPIVPGSPFAARLRGWADAGIEMLLHGYFHRDETLHRRAANRLRARYLTASEGEFLGLSRAEAGRRIRDGRDLIEQVTGQPITGFVAPAWLYGPSAIEALADCGLGFAEDHWRVWSPSRGGVRLAGGPVITWASRSRPRFISSLAAAAVLRHAPWRALRVGVHPPDCRSPALLRSIERTVSAALRARRAGRYSDLLEAKA
jgi:predicted deacetylase